jgi:hypothetical protein
MAMSAFEKAEAFREGPEHLWPEHNDRHYRTLLGYRLFDDQCVRCLIESKGKNLSGKCREDLPSGI